MRLTRLLLNKPHPNSSDLLRFWQVDKPKSLPVRKRKGKFQVHRPVLTEDVTLQREQFDVEYNVMRCLSSPYLKTEEDDAFHRKFGTPEENFAAVSQHKEYERMPNKPKVVSGNYTYDKKKGNIGNLLHEPQTIERMFDQLVSLRPFE